jgi:hypothetical protein
MKLTAKDLDKYYDDSIDIEQRTKVVAKTPKREIDHYVKTEINRYKPSKEMQTNKKGF